MGENTEQTTNRKTETTAQMNELNKALLELKKITGISLEVSGAAPEQIEPALTHVGARFFIADERRDRVNIGKLVLQLFFGNSNWGGHGLPPLIGMGCRPS